MLNGIVPILATPFTMSGDLDTESLKRVVESLLGSGATAMATLGLASETFALLPTERQQVLRTVREASGPEVRIVAGVGATSLATARAEAASATDAGANALMVLPPFLAKPSPQGLVDFYGQLGAEFGGVMVQDAPNSTGVQMDVALLHELLSLDGVDSVKIETSDSVEKMKQVMQATNPPVVMGGRNAVDLLEELSAGATGSMPACEFTAPLAQMHAMFRAGLDPASDFNHLSALLDFGIRPRKGWAVHKYILMRQGLIRSDVVRMPAEPLTSDERNELGELLLVWERQMEAHDVRS